MDGLVTSCKSLCLQKVNPWLIQQIITVSWENGEKLNQTVSHAEICGSYIHHQKSNRVLFKDSSLSHSKPLGHLLGQGTVTLLPIPHDRDPKNPSPRSGTPKAAPGNPHPEAEWAKSRHGPHSPQVPQPPKHPTGLCQSLKETSWCLLSAMFCAKLFLEPYPLGRVKDIKFPRVSHFRLKLPCKIPFMSKPQATAEAQAVKLQQLQATAMEVLLPAQLLGRPRAGQDSRRAFSARHTGHRWATCQHKWFGALSHFWRIQRVVLSWSELPPQQLSRSHRESLALTFNCSLINLVSIRSVKILDIPADKTS